MKKYITAAALLAAGTALASAVTFDSSFSYWVSNVDQNADVSAWSSVYGKTQTEVNALTFGGTTQTIVNAAGKTATSDYSVLNKTASLSSLYTAETSVADQYALTSYSFIVRPDTGSRVNVSTLALGVYSGNTLVGFSTSAQYVGNSTGGYNALSFSNVCSYADSTLSTETLILDSNTAYTYKVLSTSGATSAVAVETISGTNYYSSSTNSLGYGEFQMKWSNSTGGKLDGLANSGDFKKPIVRLEVSTIPEPSAFGLLAGVGALALVAARRRRKS